MLHATASLRNQRPHQERASISSTSADTKTRNVGTVVSRSTDGIVRVHGLGDAQLWRNAANSSADTFGLGIEPGAAIRWVRWYSATTSTYRRRRHRQDHRPHSRGAGGTRRCWAGWSMPWASSHRRQGRHRALRPRRRWNAVAPGVIFRKSVSTSQCRPASRPSIPWCPSAAASASSSSAIVKPARPRWPSTPSSIRKPPA